MFTLTKKLSSAATLLPMRISTVLSTQWTMGQNHPCGQRCEWRSAIRAHAARTVALLLVEEEVS